MLSISSSISPRDYDNYYSECCSKYQILPTSRYRLLTTDNWLLTTYYLLMTAHYYLPTTCHATTTTTTTTATRGTTRTTPTSAAVSTRTTNPTQPPPCRCYYHCTTVTMTTATRAADATTTGAKLTENGKITVPRSCLQSGDLLPDWGRMGCNKRKFKANVLRIYIGFIKFLSFAGSGLTGLRLRALDFGLEGSRFGLSFGAVELDFACAAP